MAFDFLKTKTTKVHKFVQLRMEKQTPSKAMPARSLLLRNSTQTWTIRNQSHLLTNKEMKEGKKMKEGRVLRLNETNANLE